MTTLTNHVRLTGVQVLGLSATRKVRPLDAQPEQLMTIEVGQRLSDQEIDVRVTARAESLVADYVYDVAGTFQVHGVRFSEQLALAFIEEVAVEVLHPYVREGMLALGRRLGVETVVIDFLKPGPNRLSPPA